MASSRMRRTCRPTGRTPSFTPASSSERRCSWERTFRRTGSSPCGAPVCPACRRRSDLHEDGGDLLCVAFCHAQGQVRHVVDAAPRASGRPAMTAVSSDRIRYADLLTSLPDLHIDVTHCLAAEEGVALEVRISGTHLGAWRGLPPTGRRVSFPLCGLFTFDAGGKLAGERIYYDRGSVLRQVGLYRDPQTLLGRLETLLAHPITVAGAYARKLVRPPPDTHRKPAT